MTRSYIPIDGLAAAPYSGLIGYPRATPRQLRTRLAEMKKLGIDAVSFTGHTGIGSLNVLGKGHAGIVLLARIKKRRMALKILRTDTRRNTARIEAERLAVANSVGVGPKLCGATRHCLLMEHIEGCGIAGWMKSVEGRGASARARTVARAILEDCYRLDMAGLDHGELSSISKHVIVGKSGQTMIDFESSSMQRRVSNVTSAAQSIFIGSGISKEMRRIYRVPAKQDIIDCLRAYKSDMSRHNFEALLGVLRLHI